MDDFVRVGGLAVVSAALPRALRPWADVRSGGQIIVPRCGEPALEQALVDAHRRRPDAIGVVIGFNDAEARCIFAVPEQQAKAL